MVIRNQDAPLSIRECAKHIKREEGGEYAKKLVNIVRNIVGDGSNRRIFYQNICPIIKDVGYEHIIAGKTENWTVSYIYI